MQCLSDSGRRRGVLVDADHVNCERTFIRYLKKHTIVPDTIKLIVITHVHFDHVGGLKDLKTRCRCPVAVHAMAASALSDGAVFSPPGTNPRPLGEILAESPQARKPTSPLTTPVHTSGCPRQLAVCPNTA
ncbi:MAG: MBL fold metallo-hydrolase [Deltaproteobacteria bacterium]|nr:MBL fold metallo-hydrolase [Deltaproteobacteria bacterium]